MRSLLVAALLALSAGFGLPGSAAAGESICVALVVDFADIGSGVSTSCATVPSGSTGYDVLRAGGHTFTVCSNGVLGTIDGKPENGCAVKDSSHYWSYWHRTPGGSSWTYSDQGAGSYRPANKSTEGWVWQNGSSRRPAAVPYSQICTSTASPSASPKATRTSPRTTGHRSSTKPYRAPQPATTTAGSTAVGTGASSPAAARKSQRATPTEAPTASDSPTPTPTDSTAPAVLSDDAADSGSSGPPWALIAGGIGVLVLGAAAAWQFRRGRPEA